MHLLRMINAAQIRAARALLNWSRKQLGEAAGVPFSTLSDFETERTASMLSTTMGKIISACEKAGVIFVAENSTQGAGVRFKRPKE
ncbi:MAG: helix-turn-helix transcriptional regulator [Rhodomicrobium sp.]